MVLGIQVYHLHTDKRKSCSHTEDIDLRLFHKTTQVGVWLWDAAFHGGCIANSLCFKRLDCVIGWFTNDSTKCSKSEACFNFVIRWYFYGQHLIFFVVSLVLYCCYVLLLLYLLPLLICKCFVALLPLIIYLCVVVVFFYYI